MSEVATVRAVPRADRRDPAADVVATVERLLPAIRDGAGRRDADRVLPRRELTLLSQSGVLAATVPTAWGGPGGGAVEAAEATRLLATVDPNVAQAPQSHFVYLRLVHLAGSDALRSRLFTDVVAGERVANAQSERHGATVAEITTRVRDADGRVLLSGEKFYATGSVLADWLAVLARDEAGDEVVAFVRRDAAGVVVHDDWDALGQRTTASGTVELRDVVVEPGHLVPRADAVRGPHGYGAFAQLLHAAIDVGIARGALTDAATFVRERSRPWPDAGVERAEDDPLLVQRFGRLEVEVRAAEAALLVAAERVDRTSAHGTDESAAEASLAVAAAKVLADRAALEVTTAAFELGGTRSAVRDGDHDRHWRNARTHTLHDPVRWKVQHLGRWAVSGTPPPRTPQL